MSKRTQTGHGFDRSDGGVISGSNNTQNARPDLEFIQQCQNNPSPLWPVSDSKHEMWCPAIRGELAFNLKPVTDTERFETISKRRFGANNIPGNGAFSETRDTISYLTTLNGLGSKTMEAIYGGADKAQRSYRYKINFLGFVEHTIGKQPNEIDKGNTLMVSKGKITIPNTGKSEITQGMDISWDIPLMSLYDQKQYGLTKCGSFEPGRLSLLTEPTPTAQGLVEDLAADFSDFRNNHHRQEVVRFWKGLTEASIAIDFQYAAAQYLQPYNLEKDRIDQSASIQSIRTPANPNNTGPVATVEGLIKTKAMATTDEDDLAILAGKMNIRDAEFPLLDSEPKRRNSLTYLNAVKPEHMAVMNIAGAGIDYYQNSTQNGVYDIIVAVITAVGTGQERRIGRAVTDATSGNYFDIVL